MRVADRDDERGFYRRFRDGRAAGTSADTDLSTARIVARSSGETDFCRGRGLRLHRHFFYFRFFRRVVGLDVIVENLDEFRDDAVTLQRGEQTSVDVDRSFRLFECTGKRYSDIGVFRFAGAVDDAPHYGEFHLFDARVVRLPSRHLLAEIGLNLLGHFLEKGASGASATGTGGDLRGEAANAHGLQDLLGDAHFLRTISARRRSQ